MSSADTAAEREDMLAELREQGIEDPRVLAAMNQVPREEFVPAQYARLAYQPRPLPIGHGQTISTPYIVALMATALDLSGSERSSRSAPATPPKGTAKGSGAASGKKLGRDRLAVTPREATAGPRRDRRRAAAPAVHRDHLPGRLGPRAAERFQVSVTTTRRWVGRYRELGEAGMYDRSSQPYRSPVLGNRRD